MRIKTALILLCLSLAMSLSLQSQTVTNTSLDSQLVQSNDSVVKLVPPGQTFSCETAHRIHSAKYSFISRRCSMVEVTGY